MNRRLRDALRVCAEEQFKVVHVIERHNLRVISLDGCHAGSVGLVNGSRWEDNLRTALRRIRRGVYTRQRSSVLQA